MLLQTGNLLAIPGHGWWAIAETSTVPFALTSFRHQPLCDNGWFLVANDRQSMITLFPTRLHWIKDDGADDPCDLCAHSPVRFEIDGDTLVAPQDGDATVSAAAIYLLRTLEQDHTEESPVGDQLFPCCGHAMYDTDDDDVVICGCPNGSNVFVSHENNGSIRISSSSGKAYILGADEWRQAILGFSDAVLDFYGHSLPKTPADDTESAGFTKMMTEWKRRRSHT